MEGFFECLHSIVHGYFFAPPRHVALQLRNNSATYGRTASESEKTARCPSDETVRKMFAVAELLVKQAEVLLPNVVEIETKLAEALETEVSLVTGKKAMIQPKILTPSLMFREPENLETVSVNANSSPTTTFFEKDKLFPQIPMSRLSLDFCGVLYNSLLVLKRAQQLRQESPKNKSNALFLTALRSVLQDFSKLQMQRDGLDHLICQAQDNLETLALQPRVLAEQLSMIDSSLFSHMNVVEELQFAGWIGKERRHRSKYITAMREFGGYISHWITWEILKPTLSMQQRAEILIHFVGIGECLAELGSYNMLAAVIRGLSTASILRLGPLFDILPKTTLMSWDNLQSMVSDPVKQRALLSKAPATCIPAFDTAYLLDLLTIEPELLCIKTVGPESIKHKFEKYCEAMEKFRLQSTRVYGIKHSLHPAVQHFLLTRPFLSTNELRAASQLVLRSDSPGVLIPEAAPIKPFHRRNLDEDDRLFLPLRPEQENVKAKEEIIIEPEEEHFSLGEQPETVAESFYPLNDAVERAARINSIV